MVNVCSQELRKRRRMQRSPEAPSPGTTALIPPSPGSGGTGEQREAQDDEKADDALRKRLKDANLDKDQQLL